MMKYRYRTVSHLTVEAPSSEAVVDFLSEGVSVAIEIDAGQLTINVKVSHGESASTWDEHEHVINLLEVRS